MVPSNGSGGRHIVRLRASQQVVTKRRFVFAKLPTTGDDRFVVLGIALLSAVLFIFVRGAKALPHLNKYVDDMAGIGPRATRSTRVFPGGVEQDVVAQPGGPRVGDA